MDAIVFTRLLGSREEHKARAAHSLLAERVDESEAADLLAHVVARESRQNRTRRYVLNGGFALVIALYVSGWLFFLFTPGRAPVALSLNLPFYGLIALWATAQTRLLRSPLLRRSVFALAERGDGRALAPLLDFSFCASPSANRVETERAFEAAAPLLERVEAGNTGQEVLPPAARAGLYRALSAHYPAQVGYHDGRLLYRGRIRPFTGPAEVDAYVALAGALARLCDPGAVPLLAVIAESAAATSEEKRVAQAASDALTHLCRRA